LDSLVHELQYDAIGSGVPIGDLLRKALVVSRKLSVQEFQSWVDNELTGYRRDFDMPDYRTISGSVYAHNLYHGWQPILFPNTDWARKAEIRRITEPAIEIERTTKNAEEGFVLLLFPPEVQRNFLRLISAPGPMQIVLAVDEVQFHGIIEGVRNTILNWALKLEEDGIMGEGMTFSEKEKQVASTINYQVNNFSGDSSGIQVQQATDRSQQSMDLSVENSEGLKKFIDLLTSVLPELGLTDEDLPKIESDIEMIKSQISSTNVNKGIVQNSFQSIRNILEGMAGSLWTFAHFLDQKRNSEGQRAFYDPIVYRFHRFRDDLKR